MKRELESGGDFAPSLISGSFATSFFFCSRPWFAFSSPAFTSSPLAFRFSDCFCQFSFCCRCPFVLVSFYSPFPIDISISLSLSFSPCLVIPYPPPPVSPSPPITQLFPYTVLPSPHSPHSNRLPPSLPPYLGFLSHVPFQAERGREGKKWSSTPSFRGQSVSTNDTPLPTYPPSRPSVGCGGGGGGGEGRGGGKGVGCLLKSAQRRVGVFGDGCETGKPQAKKREALERERGRETEERGSQGRRRLSRNGEA